MKYIKPFLISAFAGSVLFVSFQNFTPVTTSDKSTQILLDQGNYKILPPIGDAAIGGPRPLLAKDPGAANQRTFDLVNAVNTQYQIDLVSLKNSSNKYVKAIEYILKGTYDGYYDKNGKCVNIVKEKIMLHLVPNEVDPDSNAAAIDMVKSNTRRYFSFDVMFPNDFQPPPSVDQLVCSKNTWLLIAQALQKVTEEGKGHGQPPFAIAVQGQPRPGDPIVLLFHQRNSTTTNTPDKAPIVMHKFTAERNRWYNFVIQLQPATDRQVRDESKAGQVAVWIDGNLVASRKGSWGYDFGVPNDIGMPIMHLDVGLYRGSQSRSQRLLIRNVQATYLFEQLQSR